ncbi:MAG: hypothetical protein IJ475_01805 [Bacilli bacterium]|nr:hypothetical protein [Bacilli bacterium]
MRITDTSEYKEFHKVMEEYDFINPLMCYEGSFPLNDTIPETGPYYDKNLDILWLNSKKNSAGKNLYELFCERYFFSPVISTYENVSNRSLLAFYPMINSELDDDRKGRHIEFSYHYTLLNMVEGGCNIDPSIEDCFEISNIVKDYLIKERNSISAYLRGDATSEQLDRVNRRFKAGKVEINVNNLERTRDLLTKFILIVRNIGKTIEEKKAIKTDKLIECFDIDTFYMIYAKCCLHSTELCLELDKKVHNCFIQVLQYISSVNDSGMVGYNPSIRYFDVKKGRIERYSFNDLKRDVERIKKKAPYFDTFSITLEQGDDLKVFRDADALDILSRVYSDEDKSVLKMNWEFISKGERDPQTAENSSSKKTSYVSEGSVTKVDAQELLYRKMVFERTSYIYSIVGRDKFAGYVGYMYENGLVIFEKFYDDAEKTKISQSNATYIMTYENFLNFTKMSKPEIIAAIKSADNDKLRRLYHSKNWEVRLKRIVSGIDYSPEAVMFIETMLHQNDALDNNKGLK